MKVMIVKLMADAKILLIGQYLGLTNTEIFDVSCNNRTVQEKRFGMLMKWKERSHIMSCVHLVIAVPGMTQYDVIVCVSA